MFEYNRFWHFWYMLDNRHYLRTIVATLTVTTVLFMVSSFFLAPLWLIAVAVLPTLIMVGILSAFTKLSTFFFNRQNQKLEQVKNTSTDELLEEQIDLYLNRRVVCPQELLEGKLLNLPKMNRTTKVRSTTSEPFLMVDDAELEVEIRKSENFNRNPGYIATNKTRQFFIKKAAANDALSEIAAREMAEIVGLTGLIPPNAVTKTEQLGDNELQQGKIPSSNLLLSQQRISDFIKGERIEGPQTEIKNTRGVQNAVANFIANSKAAAFRAQAKKQKLTHLLYIQAFIPDATEGSSLILSLFNEAPLGQFPRVLSEKTRIRDRANAKELITKINLGSFQENFLLHLIIGSQDANPGNTLFSDGTDGTKMIHSIDHERIMPEDNYNIVKTMPVVNGSDQSTMKERGIENVFPIRLWLAGLPQANVPFSKDLINKMIASLDPEALLTYHRQKKLFSAQAIGAQLERILLIKTLFEAEAKKAKITLTPKELFLKLINNHPSYGFLKDEMQLSDVCTFMGLGQTPADADVSLLLHPQQYFPIVNARNEEAQNQQDGNARLFSDESFATPYPPRLLFFSMAQGQKLDEQSNKAGLDILAEASKTLSNITM